MKKIIYIALLLFAASCFPEPSKQQKIENDIQDKMYYKAKAASGYNEGFGTSGQFYMSSINDSIVFCQQNYHYKNIYGNKEKGKTYGYFNKRSGEDVTSMIDFYASDTELSKVPLLIK